MDASRFENLWADFLSGATLSLAEENELADRLTDSAELRDRLLRDGELDAALRTLGRCERTEWRFTASVMNRIETEEYGMATALLATPRAESSNGHESPSPAQRNGSPFASNQGVRAPVRRRWPVLLAVAAAASIALSTGLLFWLKRDAEPGQLPGPDNIVKNPLPDLEPLRNVARLTRTADDCVWEGLKPEGRMA